MKDNGEIILFAIEGKIKHAETTLAKIHKACILLDNNIEHNCSRRHKRRQINGETHMPLDGKTQYYEGVGFPRLKL